MPLDLLGIFGAGVLTFVTPCVLPLVPIYLAALAGGNLEGAAAGRRGQILFRAVLFALGFTAVFTLLGLTATASGGFLADHKPLLQLGGALLILLFGLHFLGAVRIPLLERVVHADESRLQTRFGGVNAVVMGVVFALGWSPCVGPVLGSVLTYTASTASNPWAGAGYLAIYGAGFALPLLVVAGLAEAGLRLLKRIRPHLHRVERAVGALLVAVAVTLVAGAVPELSGSARDGREVVRSDDGLPTMVALVSRDCPVCAGMKPLIEEMRRHCDGRNVHVEVVDVSADENRGLARRLRVVGVPTFVFLDGEGEEVARLVGEQTESALRQALAAVRGESCDGLVLLPGDGTAPPPAAVEASPPSFLPAPGAPACPVRGALAATEGPPSCSTGIL